MGPPKICIMCIPWPGAKGIFALNKYLALFVIVNYAGKTCDALHRDETEAQACIRAGIVSVSIEAACYFRFECMFEFRLLGKHFAGIFHLRTGNALLFVR